MMEHLSDKRASSGEDSFSLESEKESFLSLPRSQRQRGHHQRGLKTLANLRI